LLAQELKGLNATGTSVAAAVPPAANILLEYQKKKAPYMVHCKW
jgi:hypothetical protein